MPSSRDRRTGFSRRRQYETFFGYVLAIAGAIVGAVLLAASAYEATAFGTLRMSVASITVPVSSAFSHVSNGIGAIPDAIGGFFRVHGENERLRATILGQRRLLQRGRVLASENQRLRVLLHLRDVDPQTVTTARLVSSTPSSVRRFALLNAGWANGVHRGMPVRGPDGLVGRVTESAPYAARVLLLSDPDSLIPIRRARDGLPAIAAGRGDGLIDIRSVAGANVHLARGELFVTSGVGGIYAPGIPVASIERPGLDAVTTHPAANADTLDFVSVVRPFMALPPPPNIAIAKRK